MPRRLIRERSEASAFDAGAFVDDLYRRLLGRDPDAEGRRACLAELERGTPPSELVIGIATSDEYVTRVQRLTSPRRREPDRYRLAVDVSGTDPFVAFDVKDDSDFDWLEHTIIDDGYYEHGGVWTLELDDDKRIMGELLASLSSGRALELGCSSGTVLQVLAGHGVHAEGVEISRMALEHAQPEIRERIHIGDLLDLTLPTDYDLVYGLDVFEHLNPNRLSSYLEALRARLQPGGLLFANIPALGRDAVFGEVFPLYVAEWPNDVAANRPFRVLHCDDDGYPMHGHLIWAHTDWWVEQFEAAGFTRQPDAERELHRTFADHLRTYPARSSFYVFRADESASAPSETPSHR